MDRHQLIKKKQKEHEEFNSNLINGDFWNGLWAVSNGF